MQAHNDNNTNVLSHPRFGGGDICEDDKVIYESRLHWCQHVTQANEGLVEFTQKDKMNLRYLNTLYLKYGWEPISGFEHL